MTTQPLESPSQSRPLPRHVAVLGAAGGLGQAILNVCRKEGIDFTAIVRSRPERITDVPPGSRVVVVDTLANPDALAAAVSGSDAVIAALGVTPTSRKPPALLSRNMETVERALLAAGTDRIVVTNTLLNSSPGKPHSLAMKFFSCLPGNLGRGAREQCAVAAGLGRGAFSRLRWTLVRAAVNANGADERPAISVGWREAPNSFKPVSYQAMAQWMIEEAAANQYVRKAPLVSRRRSNPKAVNLSTARPSY